MNINGTTKIYGLIGNPVAHTMSPLLHNTLALKMGHNMVYTAFLVPDEKLSDAIRGAYALGIAGMNITAPYKSAVIPCLQFIDPLAEKIGGVNTLVRTSAGYIGYNTDYIGLYRAMQSEGMEICGSDILIFGAGPAARTAAFLCVDKGARRIFILNRSVDKAKNLAAFINKTMSTDALLGLSFNELSMLPEQNMIAIQGTSLGMSPHENEVLIENPDFYKRIKAGIDMIYNPKETLFMKNIRNAGGIAINGLKMLLYQGIAAYEMWNEVTVPTEYIDFAYQEVVSI